MAVISSRDQVTIPVDILREACPSSGDQVPITITVRIASFDQRRTTAWATPSPSR